MAEPAAWAVLRCKLPNGWERETIATASAGNAAFVKELGADQVIDYAQSRFEDEVTGVDAVFDTVGGEALRRSWKVLKPGGVLVSIAEKPADDWTAGRGIRALYFIVEPNRGQLTQLARLAAEGLIKPVVSGVFALARAREAYQLALRGHLRGKIVLRVD
jgi:NADPH:quinone reductase-like Zn-dependent oxidoreductase